MVVHLNKQIFKKFLLISSVAAIEHCKDYVCINKPRDIFNHRKSRRETKLEKVKSESKALTFLARQSMQPIHYEAEISGLRTQKVKPVRQLHRKVKG